MNFKKVAILLSAFFLVSGVAITYFLFLPQDERKDTEEKKALEIKINDKSTLLLTSNDSDTNSERTLYLRNNQSESILLYNADKPIYVDESSKGENVIRYKNYNAFAVYSSSGRSITTDYEYDRHDNGSVFLVDQDGNVSFQYETEYIFEALEVIDNELVVFEKQLHDTTNRFPRHLKPYFLIKKVFDDSKFIETDRKYIEPIEELTLDTQN